MRQNSIVEYSEGPDGLTINIRGKIKIDVLVLRLIWLLPWTYVCLMILLSAPVPLKNLTIFSSIFTALFIMAFYAGEIIMLYLVFWQLFGREKIIIKNGVAAIRQSIFGLGATKVFEGKEMVNFKTLSYKTKPYASIFQAFDSPTIIGGRLYFEYRGKPYRFCQMMFEDEATEVLVEFQKHLYK